MDKFISIICYFIKNFFFQSIEVFQIDTPINFFFLLDCISKGFIVDVLNLIRTSHVFIFFFCLYFRVLLNLFLY